MPTRKAKLPVSQYAASFKPESLNEEERTIDVVFSTGAKVTRYGFLSDPWVQELSMDAKSVRLDRLRKGAPVLNNHGTGMFGGVASLKDQIGVVEKASVDGKLGVATLRFSKREDVEPIFQDVKSGIIRNISVGFVIHKNEEQEKPDPETGFRLFRATDWEPFEVSFVAMPADAGAQVRSSAPLQEVECEFLIRNSKGETGMPEDNKPTTEPTVNVEEVRKQAVEAERKRVSDINQAARAAKVSEEFSQKLIADGISADEARKLILEELASTPEPETRSIRAEAGNMDESVTRREAMEEVLMHRFLPGEKEFALTEKGRRYAGMSLLRMAEEVVCQGRSYGMSRTQIVARALSSSDFASLLSNVASKSLLRGYKLAPRTFLAWTSKGTLPDYKEATRVSFGDMASLEQVLEGDEYKYGSIGEAAEKIKLLKYGKIVKVTEETIINDDLRAFTRIPLMMGAAGARLESKLVYTDTLLANPTMGQDNTALFHADHGNLAGTPSGVVEAGLSEMRQKMRQQTTVDGEDYLDLESSILIVGPAKETEARKILGGEVLGSTSPDYNQFKNSLDLVVESRVTGNQWFGSANPSTIDTIEVAYLDGMNGIEVTESTEFNADFVKMKVKHVVGVKPIDFRGLYKNAGN